MTSRIPNLYSFGLASFITISATIGAPATLIQEGMKLTPYLGPEGKKTWCAGETEVGYKEKFTEAECNLLYNIRYGYYSYQTTMMYNDNAKMVVTPPIHAAMTDMSYNVGINAVKKSSMIRYLNEGNPAKACAAITLYKYMGKVDCSLDENKKTCGGLWQRRLQMRKMCESGI